MIPILDPDPESGFPPTEHALDYPRGLLAAGGDLSAPRLIDAYRHGIFPWYSDDQPILWWSPVPRCVIFPSDVHLSRRLRRRFNQGRYQVKADRAFARVINACSKPRHDQDGTWITADMEIAYIRLHELGIAHSVEVWAEDELIGGIYGLALGQVFFGESMFSEKVDASKIALVALSKQLERWDFTLLDCQISNSHLLSMGAVEISRAQFNQYLEGATKPNRWGQAFSCEKRW